MLYRRRSLLMAAEQWWPGMKRPGVIVWEDGAYLATLYGQVKLAPGDWIVTEPDSGHLWHYQPDLFVTEYEEVDVREEEGSIVHLSPGDQAVVTAEGVVVAKAGYPENSWRRDGRVPAKDSRE